MHHWGQFNYVGSNPINEFDPDGKFRVFANQRIVYEGYDDNYRPKRNVVTEFTIVRAKNYRIADFLIGMSSKMSDVPLLGKVFDFLVNNTIGKATDSYKGNLIGEMHFDSQIPDSDFGKAFNAEEFRDKMEGYRNLKGGDNLRPTPEVLNEAIDNNPHKIDE